MNTPVVIIFFNRIEPLKKLVERLAEVKPKKVYLVSDGARANKIGEENQVMECRRFMQKLPWECEIKCNFASANMGCRCRVTSGLDWVFEQEERAIILEDDCIPAVEYFSWTEKMLDRYCDEVRVMSIGGTNLRPQLCGQQEDCVISKYPMIWGWATWRRAWQLNDKNLNAFDKAFSNHIIWKWLGKFRTELYWKYLLKHVHTSWGYRWMFSHFIHSAYCIVPPVNLVENIGMTDVNATHTSSNPYDLALVDDGWRCNELAPASFVVNDKFDCWIDNNFYSRSFFARTKWIIRKICRKFYG